MNWLQYQNKPALFTDLKLSNFSFETDRDLQVVLDQTIQYFYANQAKILQHIFFFSLTNVKFNQAIKNK